MNIIGWKICKICKRMYKSTKLGEFSPIFDSVEMGLCDKCRSTVLIGKPKKDTR